MSNARTRLTSLLLTTAVALLTGGSALASAAPAGTGPGAYQVTSTIPVGIYPTGVAVNEATDTVYVVDRAGLRGFSGASGAVTRTFPLPNPGALYSGGCGIAVNAHTNTVYVADGWLVHAFNGATGKKIFDTRALDAPGPHGCGIAVNPRTNTVYVAGNDDTVVAINGATGALKFTTEVPSGPYAVAVNEATNTVYVANRGSATRRFTAADGSNYGLGGNTVSVISGATGHVTSTIKVGDTLTKGKLTDPPSGIAVNETTNTVYVADGSDSSVSVINGATGKMTSTINAAAAAGGVAVNETTNTVYATTWANNSVQVINGATGAVTSTVAAGANPLRVAVNETTNTVYVTGGPDDFDPRDMAANGPRRKEGDEGGTVSVLSVVAGAVASVRMDNHQKTPADCPLSTFPSRDDQEKCSQEFFVPAVPFHGNAGYSGGGYGGLYGGVAAGTLPTQSGTGNGVDPAEVSILSAADKAKYPGNVDTVDEGTFAGGVYTLPAKYFTFHWGGLSAGGAPTMLGARLDGAGHDTTAADGPVSWEVWPAPSHGVTTWVNAVGFIYRPISAGTDTFALRVCREFTDTTQEFVTFTQCFYQPLKITTPGVAAIDVTLGSTPVPLPPAGTTTPPTSWSTPTPGPTPHGVPAGKASTAGSFTGLATLLALGAPTNKADTADVTSGRLIAGGAAGGTALLALGVLFVLRRRGARTGVLAGGLALLAVVLLGTSAASLGSHYLGSGNSHPGRELSSGPLPPSLAPTPAAAATPGTPPKVVPGSPGFPVQLVVPSHHLTAAVSANPLDAAGNIFVPPNPRAVSWASQDAAPGSAQGTIILAAHINYAGVAGAFSDLASYRTGQIITLVMADGRKLNYRVAAEPLEVPKAKVGARGQELFDQTSSFGPAGSPKSGRLLLVSCGGAFDNRTGHYESNIFVYALPV